MLAHMRRASRRRRLRCCLALLLALALALLAGAAGAAEPRTAQQELDLAEQAYANLQVEEAGKSALRVTKMRGLTHDQLVRAYKVLARSMAVLDKPNLSREAYQFLLTYDPTFEEDTNQSPKLRDPFLEARGNARAAGVAGIDLTAQPRAGAPGTLRVSTHDPSHIVKRVATGWRWPPSGDYQTKNVAVADDVIVDVAAPPANAARLEFYAQAFDERDDVVFEAGNPDAPKTLMLDVMPLPQLPVLPGPETKPIEREQPQPTAGGGGSIFRSPIFWTAVGVVVVGGAVATYFIVKGGSGSSTLGSGVACGGSPCN
jgi:hypothetical protein